jgi:hypothetical protein
MIMFNEENTVKALVRDLFNGSQPSTERLAKAPAAYALFKRSLCPQNVFRRTIRLPPALQAVCLALLQALNIKVDKI